MQRTNKGTKRICVVGSVLCLMMVLSFRLTPVLAAEHSKKVSLQLRWDHQFQFAGYYAAKWQGYYAEAGFDVEIRSAITADRRIRSAVKEVADGAADFGVGAAYILIARDQGVPLVVLASIFQQSAAEFYAKAGTQLVSPADLLRLKVARNVGDLIDIEMQVLLRAEGLDPNKVVAYPHIPGDSHLLDGRVDVIPGYSLSAPYSFRRQGQLTATLRPINYGIDFYGDSLFTHERMTRQDPQSVERFRQATLRGWQYTLEHPEEMIARISAELPRNDKSAGEPLLEFNRFQSSVVKDLTHYPLVELGHMNPQRWRRMA